MKTIDIREVSNLKMVSGNEKRVRKIVQDGVVKEWVGFGWVEVRKATPRDLRTLRVVV